MSIENAIQLVVGGIIVGGIYALLALGIHIVYVQDNQFRPWSRSPIGGGLVA
jgi:hypothetical protein